MTPCTNCKASGSIDDLVCPVCAGHGDFKTPTLFLTDEFSGSSLSIPLTYADLAPFGATFTPTGSRFHVDLSEVFHSLFSTLNPGPTLLFSGSFADDISYHSHYYLDAPSPTLLDAALARHFGQAFSSLDQARAYGRAVDAQGYLVEVHWSLRPLPVFSDLLSEMDTLTTALHLSYRLARYEGNITTGETGWSVLLTDPTGMAPIAELAVHQDPSAALTEALIHLGARA